MWWDKTHEPLDEELDTLAYAFSVLREVFTKDELKDLATYPPPRYSDFDRNGPKPTIPNRYEDPAGYNTVVSDALYSFFGRGWCTEEYAPILVAGLRHGVVWTPKILNKCRLHYDDEGDLLSQKGRLVTDSWCGW